MSIISAVNNIVSNKETILTEGEDLRAKDPATSKENVMPTSGKGMSSFVKWTAKSITALALLLPFAEGNKTDAASNKQRENAVAKFAQEAWNPLKLVIDQNKKIEEVTSRNILWNNLQASFHVSDDTMIEALESIRAEVLDKGASNPNIPARIVHGALYTTATSAKRLNLEIAINEKKSASLTEELKSLQKQATGLTNIKASLPQELKARVDNLQNQITSINNDNAAYKTRRDKMALTVIPYLGKVIVDYKTEDGRKLRYLVQPAEASKIKGGEVYSGNDFDKIGSFAVGTIGEQVTLDNAAKELINSGNETERRNMFFDTFFYTNQDKVPKAIIEKSKEWVFGNTQLRAHKKAKADKAEKEAAKPVMPVAPKLDNSMEPAVPPATKPVPPPIPNPGLPPGSKTGSLEGLKELDEKLVSPLLFYPFAKDNSEQKFIAKNILFLAQNNNEFALPACAQWFAIKPYEADSKSSLLSADTDFMVLEALAKLAQKDKLAFKVLERVAASNPQLFSNAFIAGSVFLDNWPDITAGREIVKAFSANPNSARDLITALAERNAKLIWTEPVNEQDIKSVNDLKSQGRTFALFTMARLDKARGFTPYLRGVLNNPLTTVNDRFRAAVGVALAKDKESVEPLLALAVNESADSNLRSLALEAVLFINAPDVIPQEIRQRASEESPFHPTGLRHHLQDARKDAKRTERKEIDLLSQFDMKNPFHARISSEYTTWLNQQESLNKASQAKGRTPAQVTDEQKLMVASQIVRKTFGGNEGVLRTKAKDFAFSAKYLQPMVNYLNSCKDFNKHIDLWLALPMMDILSKSNYKEASTTLADIATNPERYVKDHSKRPNFFGLLFAGYDTAMLRLYAIEDLGGTVPLNDANNPNAKILHTIARKDTSSMFRWASLYGLEHLADRYDAYFNGLHDTGPDNIRTIAARKAHADQILGHMAFHQKGLEDTTQVRLSAMYNEFAHAKLADRFGATKDLLNIANEAHKTNSAAQVIRSVMHALISNQHRVEDIHRLGFEPKAADQLATLYSDFEKQRYWLGNISDQPRDGKGTETAIMDVGYVYPLHFYPELNKKIIYPENFIRWSDLSDFLDLHPTAVFYTRAKGADRADSKFWTYSLIASIPEIPFRPGDTQDAGIFGHEDMAQNMLDDKANIEVVNHSYGFYNFVLHNEKLRSEWIDQYSAFMELLGTMGTKHTVAAGNEHGDFPPIVRYGSQGEVLSTGLRFTNDGKTIKPDNVFFASAMDKYADRLAEFTSKQDPLRTAEAINMTAFQGVHVIAPWVDNGKWVLEPVNGTSFAAPNNSRVLALGIETRKKLGLRELTSQEWQGVLERSTIMLPERERWEGGRAFDATRFMQEVVNPNPPVPNGAPVIANKK